jgi:hypothetical protein
MTTSERREMVEEAQALMEEGRHPWPMLLKALEVGDRSVAEAVAEAGSSRFSAREKIAAAAIKWTFPESPEEWRGRQEEAHEESTRQIAEALTRQSQKNTTKAKLALKPSIGWNVPKGRGRVHQSRSGWTQCSASFAGFLCASAPEFHKIRTLYDSDDAA